MLAVLAGPLARSATRLAGGGARLSAAVTAASQAQQRHSQITSSEGDTITVEVRLQLHAHPNILCPHASVLLHPQNPPGQLDFRTQACPETWLPLQVNPFKTHRLPDPPSTTVTATKAELLQYFRGAEGKGP